MKKPDPQIYIVLYWIATVLIVAAVIISLSSCSMFRKVDKSVTKTDVKTDVTTNQATKVTETEVKKTDTTIMLSGSIITAEKPLQKILEGDSIVSENNQIKGAVTYDKNTGKLKLTAEQKPQSIPVKIDINKTKVTETNTKQNIKSEVKQKEVAKKNFTFNLAWLWLLVIPVLGYLGFRYYKKLVL